jgi:hypothetical protein
MKSQDNRDVQLKLDAVEQSELAHVSGGVMGTYDQFGNLIATCTGPVRFPLSQELLKLFSKPY